MIIDNGGSFRGLSMFVYMNMFSQVVNWTITILYFVTGISKRMQNSIAIDAFKTNLSNLMRNTLLQLQVLISDDADARADEELQVSEDGSVGQSDRLSGSVGLMRDKLQHEIKTMKNKEVDLKNFEPIEILTLRRAVYMQFAEEFSKN
jgi:hypothetical protein